MKVSVSVVLRLEINCTLEVTAKDADAAEAKVQKMIDNSEILVANWEPKELPAKFSADWTEADQTAEVEYSTEEE